MSRRTLLGIGSFWMLAYLPVFAAVIVIAVVRGDGDPDGELIVPFGVLLALHLLAIAVSLATVVFLCVDAFQNPRVDRDERILWLVLLIVLGAFAMPVYWWKYVR